MTTGAGLMRNFATGLGVALAVALPGLLRVYAAFGVARSGISAFKFLCGWAVIACANRAADFVIGRMAKPASRAAGR